MVLRSDTQAPLSPSAVHDGVSYATAQLRRQRRVVGGSVERASPYWRARRSAGLLPGVRPDGPQRARLPVMRGEWERYQAAYLRMLSLSRKAKAPEPAASEDESDSDGATPPGEHRRQLVNMVNEVLPRLAEWDEADERQLREGRFGWLYAAPCDARVPRSTLLQALHYYVARFYDTHGLLRPVAASAATTDATPDECERARDESAQPMPEMEPGSPLWTYWAHHSLGWARTMAWRMDASALVALGTLVEALVEELVPRAAPVAARPVASRRRDAEALCEARRAQAPAQRGISRYWAHAT
ncbi:unnamed protein product [Malassezia sympodialis ATCC 42132]|nr:uncharacterized protein MSY001_0992 [Malassezia sympodialis ATCC 42132]CCU98286.1 unnamed protein product [Malassezia sympodialis ATCC 42132]|eukprot:XP_018739601.1 uncharacterized protein MSY001_0992 [Malassezia sympodialis ATCC 42132]